MPLTELDNAEFLSLLVSKHVQILAQGERLQINAPAGVIDAQVREELVRRKAELLVLLGSGRNQPTHIPRRGPGVNVVPQTPAQQGIWLISHFDPNNVTYNIPQAFLLPVPLDTACLQSALNALIAHHEVLRTSFYQHEGETLQRILPQVNMHVGITDLSTLDPEKQDHRVKALIRDHARIPFDLAHPPLIRFHVFRMGKRGDVLFWNIHHIIADQSSLIILRQDLLQLYEGFVNGKRPVLSQDSVQFADFALWSAEQLKSHSVRAQTEYWERKLAGTPPTLELPHSLSVPEKRTSFGQLFPIRVDSLTQTSLKRIGQEAGVTPFMVFLAAFALLLSRASGQEDFCIGSPITHRKHLEAERTIGLFVNMLAFRCHLPPEISFYGLLQQIRSTALEAFEHSDVPFQWLLRRLKPNRRSQASPIFQTLFVLNSQVKSTQAYAEPLTVEAGIARYDLTLDLSELGTGGLAGTFEYCTDLFTRQDIDWFSEAFLAVLKSVSEVPDRRLDEVVLPPRKRQDALLHTRDERRCSETPRWTTRFERWTKKLFTALRAP